MNKGREIGGESQEQQMQPQSHKKDDGDTAICSKSGLWHHRTSRNVFAIQWALCCCLGINGGLEWLT